ncbi:flagellar motor protein MotS [Alkalicoccus luteus]|uniref:Flagellar motor protein MotB n=1 Tax=Alkalicoccus luteus TaxID=1237094 RepID=A0A969PML1_9BACI|nr:flagellar motor protein MotS [Alkalicoccus luteus]NJP36972.1 flagellar motor protein MotB [Alkalicoccus luteus]
MNRRRREEERGAPKWMVTFSDMMTLILVFFILLFSMSVVDATKFRAIADSFQDRAVFDGFPSVLPFESPAEEREQEVEPSDGEMDPFEPYEEIEQDELNEQLDELLEDVNEYLEENEFTEEITASRDDRGVVLVLQEQALFATARADLIDEAEPFLDKVSELLDTIPNMVKVEGHTDSRPINTMQFPSNWELSGARASSVIRYITEAGDLNPQRFMAAGYGDTRPVAPNTSEENLQQNRRVVIVISDPSFDEDDLY